MMKTLRLPEVDSTNSYVKRNAATLDDMTFVTAANQTGGRGQRGNSWESAPGKNLTFSLLWKPKGFPARRQFSISEAVALSVADLLAAYGIEAKVKWPNDIYVGDKKICGILIEHSPLGADIQHTIIGAGINVNQTKFESDAPNPVSICQILGKETSLEEVGKRICELLENRLESIMSDEGKESTHTEFLQRTYRGDGKLYPFVDAATQSRFMAYIADIEPQGFLVLKENKTAAPRRYAFKEVAYIIE